MLNFDSSNNIVVLFSGYCRGNFVRNCLTLAPNTGDALLQNSTIEDRLKLYMSKVTNYANADTGEPWGRGPGHMDPYNNYDHGRFDHADECKQYIHCGHLDQIPTTTDKDGNLVENIYFFKKKYVVISVTDNDLINVKGRRQGRPGMWDIDLDIENYSDKEYLTHYLNTDQYYDLPYSDIMNLDSFILHCKTLIPDCYEDEIATYYKEYFKYNP